MGPKIFFLAIFSVYKGIEMAKTNVKNIDTLCDDLKNRFNNFDKTGLDFGVVVFQNNLEDKYPLSLAENVKAQILKGGNNAEVISLPGISERFRLFENDNYILNAYKNQVANMLELVFLEKKFDGVVFIANGFYSSVGSVMASIRLNLPTIFLPIGISQKVLYKNLHDVLCLPGQIAKSEKSVFDYKDDSFCENVGSGVTFSSENLFNIILEIMELAPKNSSTTLANSFEKIAQAKDVGNKIVELAKSRLPLKKLINRKSINNAVMLNFCLGGNLSILNALKQICAESELDFDIAKILANSKDVPVLFNTYMGISTFLKYGGTWTLIKAMIKEKIIDGNYKTISDSTLAEETKNIKEFAGFTTLKANSLCILRGNIAEKLSVAKTICLPDDMVKVVKKAIVFNNDAEGANAVLNKVVEENHIIVIKNAGNNTKTGFCTISQTAMALKSMDKTNIILTDGLVEEDIDTPWIGFVLPDSKDGNIRLIKDDDEIEIDFAKGKINLNIGGKELNNRQKKYINEHKILPKFMQN